MSTMKICKDCQQTLNREENFYKAGASYQSRCKQCHILKRREYKYNRVYEKKGRGWESYPEEKRNDIKKLFDDKVKPKEIKVKYDVCMPTVYKWKKICAQM
jgi:hypothetical protein